jgi:hypothetical protein
MSPRLASIWIPTLLTLLASFAPATRAQDACMDFKWDVSKERALFAGPPTVMEAGTDVKSAPIVLPNHLYQLALAAQKSVNFSVRQGKKNEDDAYAGLAILRISAAGSYRVSVDLPVWIDVVTQDSVLQPADFQGQHDCAAPRKVVVFDLKGTKPFLLQFSGAAIDQLLVTITPVPERIG